MKETPMEKSLTRDVAYGCLLVNEDGTVHSYVKGLPGYLFGAVLTEERVRGLLSKAEEMERLYMVKGGILDHNIKAWDEKTDEWIYLRCKEDSALM